MALSIFTLLCTCHHYPSPELSHCSKNCSYSLSSLPLHPTVLGYP